MAASKNSSEGKRGRKRRYERSTPVTRLRRNVDKISRHAELCRVRICAWISADSEACSDLTTAGSLAERIESLATELDSKVAQLELVGYVPQKASEVWRPGDGEKVAIAPKSRQRFETIFASFLKDDPTMLNNLVVRSTLPTGEIVVQRGKRTPFPVRKSHLCPAAE